MVNIEAGTSAIEAAKIMRNHKIGSVFVKRKDRIIGIVMDEFSRMRKILWPRRNFTGLHVEPGLFINAVARHSRPKPA